MSITQERLREVLDYNPETGVFTWKVRVLRDEFRRTDKVWNTRWAGKVAGFTRPDGYIGLMVDGRKCQAHRAAWLYLHGSWPPADLDHIDGDKSNNAAWNLRHASRSKNMANIGAHADNSVGAKGVYRDRRTGKFVARISPNGRSIHLGVFDNLSDAKMAYARAAAKHFGEFARSV